MNSQKYIKDNESFSFDHKNYNDLLALMCLRELRMDPAINKEERETKSKHG